MAETVTPDSQIKLGTPVADLPGVGPDRALILTRLELRTVGDLLRHYPMRYEQQAAEGYVRDLPTDAVATLRGMVLAARPVNAFGRGKSRFEVSLQDDAGDTVQLVWFNATWLSRKIHPGMRLLVQGKVKTYRKAPQIVNPKWEALPDAVTEPAARDERLRPVYPATTELSSTILEPIIHRVLDAALPLVQDPLPEELLEHHAMPPLAEAIRMMHRPADGEEIASARRRLAFNELLLLQLGIAMKRRYVADRMIAPALPHNAAIDEHIRGRFPFPLTPQQDEVVRQIAKDVQLTKPMNRMLQGDVGAGKTVVALYAMLMAVLARKQAAMMAPTELLAEQHFLSVQRMLEGTNVRVGLLTGTPGPQRTGLIGRIRDGGVDIVVGTHALLGKGVKFADLGLVVIDEQHRFGVMQRAAFRSGEQAEGDPVTRVPHHLVMTATPIPRTLSLTVFGDLDVSTIAGLPPGRTPIVSRVVAPDTADEVYRYLATRLERGEQAYVVVPAIDASGNETKQQLKSVREHARELQEKYFKAFNVAAVHGRLKRDTRERIMDRFRRGKVHVLVATTVIEVGVDVPNATCMVIEHAERFGLAQLHQLRGRIGRGQTGRRNLCVFIAEPTTEDAQKRMEAIAGTTDGFKIAEMDLEIRGMGDFFGTRQSGLPPLKVAQIPGDMDLLLLAKRDAATMIENDPLLRENRHKLLRKVLLNQYGEALGLIDVG